MCFFADIWKRWASLNTPNTAKTGHTKVFRHLNGTENQFSPVSSFSLACTTADYRNLPRDLLTQNVFLAQHAN